MPAKHILKVICLFCLVASSLLACSVVPNLTFNGTPLVSSSSSDSSTELNVWKQIKPGIELRYEHWKGVAGNEDTVMITRFDPHTVHFSVNYSPDKPQTMKSWMQQTGATVIINGGYFNAQDQAEALVVSNGQAQGVSYQNCCGMFQVDAQGNASVRSLADQPYDPSEQLQQATQSRPMLVINGKRTQFQEDSSSSRRTVVAMDTQGRILFIVCPSESFSMDELADLLVQSDLSIKTALNLDGGSSTGLYINGDQKVTLDSINPLPIVITAK